MQIRYFIRALICCFYSSFGTAGTINNNNNHTALDNTVKSEKMKTLELRGKKLAEVWVVQETVNSCYDNSITIKDNKEDALAHFNKRHSELKEYARKNGLSLIDESSQMFMLSDANNGVVRIVVMRCQRFELTDK